MCEEQTWDPQGFTVKDLSGVAGRALSPPTMTGRQRGGGRDYGGAMEPEHLAK